jgi:hypothetical protein
MGKIFNLNKQKKNNILRCCALCAPKMGEQALLHLTQPSPLPDMTYYLLSLTTVERSSCYRGWHFCVFLQNPGLLDRLPRNPFPAGTFSVRNFNRILLATNTEKALSYLVRQAPHGILPLKGQHSLTWSRNNLEVS